MLSGSPVHAAAALARQLFESPLVRKSTPPDIGVAFIHSIRDRVHASEVILQIVSTAELFAVAAALAVHTFPILAGDLVHALLMTFAIVWCSESFRS